MLLTLVSKDSTKIESLDDAIDLEVFVCMTYEEDAEVDVYKDGELIYTISPNEDIDLEWLQKYFN